MNQAIENERIFHTEYTMLDMFNSYRSISKTVYSLNTRTYKTIQYETKGRNKKNLEISEFDLEQYFNNIFLIHGSRYHFPIVTFIYIYIYI